MGLRREGDGPEVIPERSSVVQPSLRAHAAADEWMRWGLGAWRAGAMAGWIDLLAGSDRVVSYRIVWRWWMLLLDVLQVVMVIAGWVFTFQLKRCTRLKIYLPR